MKVLTFDVVGTLIDFETGIAECLRAFSDDDAESIVDAFGRAEGQQQAETPWLPFTSMLGPICERMGLPAEAAEALRSSIPSWPAFPDAVDALRELGQRYRLVALTNADNWALAHMSAMLGDPFSDSVTAEDVGVNKPDPRVFAYCLGRQSVLGYRVDDFLHVAQSQFHDIGVASRLGIRTCWVERRAGKRGSGGTPAACVVTPDLHVGSLGELVGGVLGGRGLGWAP